MQFFPEVKNTRSRQYPKIKYDMTVLRTTTKGLLRQKKSISLSMFDEMICEDTAAAAAAVVEPFTT